MPTRAFTGRGGSQAPPDRLPPGQHVTRDFPVLSAGPTSRTPLDEWSFSLADGDATLAEWSWREFQDPPRARATVDIHRVTKWSKSGTVWEGVTFDALLEAAGIDAPEPHVMALCDGGYSTNLPVEDLTDGKAMVTLRHRGLPLEPVHGGPARLLVPQLCFWKSAKWVRGLGFMPTDEPGSWEERGYHLYGDPRREQRYAGD